MDLFDDLNSSQQDFIRAQKVFFVASAPLSGEGRVNLSPKGLDSLAILSSTRLAYIDLGGSGIETHAHMLENGRLSMMFCAFENPPLILRVYGTGEAHPFGTEGFDALRPLFPAIEVPVRGIIELNLNLVQESCGWGVPLYDFKGQRDTLVKHNASRTQEFHTERRYDSNAKSLDGLPGLTRP
ncbi:MAG: hypothetical protein ACI8TQ_003629 [Planctomycetota bacterium]|jgi:hypothetical protein